VSPFIQTVADREGRRRGGDDAKPEAKFDPPARKRSISRGLGRRRGEKT
jgi:hypothetical protein